MRVVKYFRVESGSLTTGSQKILLQISWMYRIVVDFQQICISIADIRNCQPFSDNPPSCKHL